MKNLSFEVHRYAPELTKAFFNGIGLDLKLNYAHHNMQDRKQLVRAVRESRKFAKPKVASIRIATIRKVYSEEQHKWLNGSCHGSFRHSKTVLDTIDKMYEPQSVLMDGSTLPEPIIMVSFGKNGKSHDVTKIARDRYNQGKSVKTRI